MKIKFISGAVLVAFCILQPLYADEITASDRGHHKKGGFILVKGGSGHGEREVDNDGPPPMGSPSDRHGMMFGDPERMREKLNLTDDQMDKIEDLNEKYFDEHKKIRDKIRPKMRALRKLLDQDAVDIDKARVILKEISELQVETRILMIRQKSDIDKVLTKEQRDKARRERPSRPRMPMMPDL